MPRRLIPHPFVLLGGLSTSWIFVSAVSAATWKITADGLGDAPSIQAGIDSSASGDTVLVHPGTYNENITIQTKIVVVRSSGGPSTTTIDGTGLSGRVVTFETVGSRSAVLEGFRITNGAGGILVHNSQPSVVGNEITNNGLSADVDGGGIWLSASLTTWFPFIKGNKITGNRARNLGGGIGFAQRMVPEVLDNTITDNEAVNGDGGGIYYRSFDDGTIIRGNIIINNKAGDHGGGIYAALVNQPPPALEIEISWNLVANNVAFGGENTGTSGGGIHLIETDAWVHHNTIVGNEGGSTPSTLGGGIGVERIGSPLIEKNIIALTTRGGGVNCVDGATPILRNNLAWQNAGGHGVGQCPTWWQSDGNIVDDPAFCDPDNGDYSVAQNSPAMTHPAGPLGALYLPGCGPVAVRPTTWGRIKSMYGH